LRGYIYNDQGQFLYGSDITERLKGIEQFVAHWESIR
jgi:hypothetical protein